MAQQYKLLIENIRQLVQVAGDGRPFLRGGEMGRLVVLEEAGAGYSVLVGRDGKIAAVAPSSELSTKYAKSDVETVIDATGKCLLPGLVDAHTHPIWEGDRVHEFAMKLAGATYMDVHQMGGGINFTVRHTQQASEVTLYSSLTSRLRQMVSSGTTLVECKSGYGLDLENEVKMLRVLDQARRREKIDVSSTYCGAHAVPVGKSAQEATDDIISHHIPHIQSLMASGEMHVDNIDVFCERGVYDVTQSRAILMAGKNAGLQINFHGEELHRLHSAEMGVELGAKAISHLEEISEEGIQAMAGSDTVAVVLPTTAYNLRLRPPPVRAMIDAGVIVALGTDFNPNAYCLDMPLVMNLACVTMKMSMPEALAAATLNSAHALGRSTSHGSIEVGKWGNLILLDTPSWEHLIYQMGNSRNVISSVIWHGEVVYDRSKQ
ncbi:probable imidazolonepropionase [Physella acuta]|uniref:probable imidazolonepropionase n=1 Tax=Physella acuta TaxID=109671 RepID=UPI0027DCABD6|nr:probable imidazolonepropionase [Physella acuta]